MTGERSSRNDGPAVASSRVRWIADAEGFAHAVKVRSPITRTVCGLLLADALPTTLRVDRCSRCAARVALLPTAEHGLEPPRPARPVPVIRRVDAGHS